MISFISWVNDQAYKKAETESQIRFHGRQAYKLQETMEEQA